MKTSFLKCLPVAGAMMAAGAVSSAEIKVPESSEGRANKEAHAPQTSALPEVDNNIVLSRSNPKMAIKVTDTIPFIGRHSIRIRDEAAGERLIFADTQDGKIKRMVILQFEGFLPGVEGRYNYDFSQAPKVAGYPFRSNAYAFDMRDSRSDEPKGEAAGTARFLEAQGLVVPDVWMMWRSLTAALPERRDELIIFYVEPGSHEGISDIDAIYDLEAESEKPFWQNFKVGLEKRANAAYSLAPFDYLGQKPDERLWQYMPTRAQLQK